MAAMFAAFTVPEISASFMNVAVASAATLPVEPMEISLLAPVVSVTLPVPSASFVAVTAPETVILPPTVTETSPADAETDVSVTSFLSLRVTLLAFAETVLKSLFASCASTAPSAAVSVVAPLSATSAPMAWIPPAPTAVISSVPSSAVTVTVPPLTYTPCFVMPEVGSVAFVTPLAVIVTLSAPVTDEPALFTRTDPFELTTTALAETSPTPVSPTVTPASCPALYCAAEPPAVRSSASVVSSVAVPLAAVTVPLSMAMNSLAVAVTSPSEDETDPPLPICTDLLPVSATPVLPDTSPATITLFATGEPSPTAVIATEPASAVTVP